MSETIYRGTISFVHYEKHFATIDYIQDGKSKTINFQAKIAGAGGKTPFYRVGDEVSFILRLTPRGDRLNAYNVKVNFNPKLEKLIQKAGHENRFTGYLKKVDDEVFIKEIETYLFLPLQLSPWENHPGEQSYNTEVTFKLANTEKPSKVFAELYYQVFIPEYRQAQQSMEQKQPLPATVSRISPYALYADLFGGRIPVKISLPAEGLSEVKVGDTLQVLITYLSPTKIVVEPAG